ncbi:hypothetical protein IJD34_00470, partial [bacterium]|nr:hypothetical protein [bacterium]
ISNIETQGENYKISLNSDIFYSNGTNEIIVKEDGALIKPLTYFSITNTGGGYSQKIISRFILNNIPYALTNEGRIYTYADNKLMIVSLPYKFKKISKNTFLIYDENNNPIKYTISASNVSLIIPEKERKLVVKNKYKTNTFKPQKEHDFTLRGNKYWISGCSLIVEIDNDYYHLGSIMNEGSINIRENFKVIEVNKISENIVKIKTTLGDCILDVEQLKIKSPQYKMEYIFEESLAQPNSIQEISRIWKPVKVEMLKNYNIINSTN